MLDLCLGSKAVSLGWSSLLPFLPIPRAYREHWSAPSVRNIPNETETAWGPNTEIDPLSVSAYLCYPPPASQDVLRCYLKGVLSHGSEGGAMGGELDGEKATQRGREDGEAQRTESHQK